MVEKICKRCNGTGWIMQFDSLFKPFKADCPECEGSGYVLEKEEQKRVQHKKQ